MKHTLKDTKVGDRVMIAARGYLSYYVAGKPTVVATIVRKNIYGDADLAWRKDETLPDYPTAPTLETPKEGEYPGFVRVMRGRSQTCPCDILPPEPKTDTNDDAKTEPQTGSLIGFSIVAALAGLCAAATKPKPRSIVRVVPPKTLEDDLLPLSTQQTKEIAQ